LRSDTPERGLLRRPVLGGKEEEEEKEEEAEKTIVAV